VLFDKIASVYRVLKMFEKYIYLLALEMVSPENQHCARCIGTLLIACSKYATACPILRSASFLMHRIYARSQARGHCVSLRAPLALFSETFRTAYVLT